MCLVLFQGCRGHATKEKMRVGAKERPQGMLTRQLARPTESSTLEELKIPPNVPQQQSCLGFLGHGPSHAKERTQFQRQSPTTPHRRGHLHRPHPKTCAGCGHPRGLAWAPENPSSSRCSCLICPVAQGTYGMAGRREEEAAEGPR